MTAPFSVVLSGGGCKVFWANGVLQVLGPELPPITNWAGSSAGAAFSLAHVAGRFEVGFDRFLQLVAENERNFNPRRALRRQRPFPHNDIYRDSVRHLMQGEGFERVRAGAPVHIFMSYVLPGQPFVQTSFNAVRVFADRRRRGVLHGPAQPPPGIGIEVANSRDAEDLDQLLDWTLMSSTIPPITPIQRREGRRYLDGGLVDNIPIRALPKPARSAGAKVLCLVSHNVRVPERAVRIPDGAEVLYLAALSPLPVRVWDYTSPERVVAAIELGRRDAAVLRDRALAFADRALRARAV